MIHLYGIPTCDSVKKARKYLDANSVNYAFHDYKKEGACPARVRAWAGEKGWEVLLNRRGTTFRKLDDAEKADLEAEKAMRLMAEHPSLIKRPVVEHEGGVLVGFDEAQWNAVLA